MRSSILLLALLLASSASADPPSIANSTFPSSFTLVGGRSGSADPVAAATCVIRDLSNNPAPSVEVVLDLSACTDVRLSPDMADPGIVVDCANKTVRGITDVNGRVIFNIVGSGAGGPPRAIPACLEIRVFDQPRVSRMVSAFDLDGINGVNALDLSIAFGYLNTLQYNARVDYDSNGVNNPIDLTLLFREVNNASSVVSGVPCGP